MLRRPFLGVVVLLLLSTAAKAEDFGEIRAVRFAPQGKLAAFAVNNNVRLWDTLGKRKVGELKGHTDAVTSLAFAPDGKTLFTASLDKTVRQWGLATGKVLRSFDGSTAAVECVAASPDGKTLASAGRDHLVRLWDVSTGKERLQFKGHESDVLCIAFSPDGSKVVSSGGERVVRLWDVKTGQELRTFEGHELVVRAAAFTPDGKRVVTGSCDNHVRVFDAASGQHLFNCDGHEGEVLSLAVSPDNRLLASGARDGTVRFWDLDTGRLLKRLECHAPGVLCLSFSPDGRSLLSGGYDCNVNLWETALGKLRLEYKPNTDLPAPAPQPLTASQLGLLWKTLAEDDAAKGYDALLTLSARPQETVPFLQKQLKAATDTVDVEQMQKYLANLDDDDFMMREQATSALRKLGRLARVPMQNALAKTRSVEMRRRLDDLLKGLEKNDLPAKELQEMRALEILELAHTSAAKQLLETLAAGTASAELTVAAKAGLARLAKQP